MSFSVSQQPVDTRLFIKISGSIDEDSNFQPVEAASFKGLVLDLEGVTAINSVGIREWIKWTKTLPPAVPVTLCKCPKIIVDQINMVSGFLPAGAQVESFFVPYYSDASGNEKMVLFTRGKEFKDGQLNPPEQVTDESGEAMELDVIETKYFKFIKNA